MKLILVILLTTVLNLQFFGQKQIFDINIQQLKSVRKNKSRTKIEAILLPGTKWEGVAVYDVISDTIHKKNIIRDIEIVNDSVLKFGASKSKIIFIKRKKFEVIYPYAKQTYKLIYHNNDVIILESKYINVTTINGETVSSETKHFRYLWKRIDE